MPTFDKCKQPEEILNSLKDFAKNPKGFLLLAGKNGTGKTYAAECIRSSVNIWDSDHKIFISQVDLNIKWQNHLTSVDPNAVNYLLGQLRSSQLLIIDDLGTRTPSEAFMDFLYALMDSRYRGKDYIGTIITTNLNAKDMREKFGDAFVSRVASGKCFRFEGEDRRFKDW